MNGAAKNGWVRRPEWLGWRALGLAVLAAVVAVIVVPIILAVIYGYINP
jgi:hypothetical protein